MLFGIVGLSKSGKSTVFNALTRGRAETTASIQAFDQPNLGVAQVSDPRLDTLTAMFSPERTIPAEIHYTDIPGAAETPGKGHAIGGLFLNTLQQTDALLVVARAFQNPSVPHLEGTIDPYRDAATMQLELAFSDLIILERRAQRLEKDLKGAKSTERDRIQRESAFIDRLKEGLEANIPVREQSLSSEEQRTIATYQFLTAKPLLILFNIDEEQLPNVDSLEQEMTLRLDAPGAGIATMCGKLEMELAQMDPKDELEFRTSLDAGESGAAKMVRLSYHLVGLVSFFTTGPDEVKAWTIPMDTPADQAARRIHSDMERGFIRAEVVSYSDLNRCGSIADARRQGLLRAEGRTYPVRDGDVITFLFNV